VILELQRADRVRDALYGVGLPVSEVVGRVDEPRVAGARVRGMQDPVEDRITHVDVPGSHVDARPKDTGSVRELARPHAGEEVEVLVDRPVAPGTLAPRLGQRAAVLADLVGRQVVDVGLAGLDEADGPREEPLEVVRGEVQVLAPVEPEPADVGLDSLDVLLLFLHRVGVVEAQVTAAAVLTGDAEVEADRLSVPDVEVAVRLGREAGDDNPDPTVAKIGGDELAEEIAALGREWCLAVHRRRG
jgi:hypothetical protein